MMFGSVSNHFANPRHVKDEKLMFRAWMHYFGVPMLWSIHSSPLDAKWCLRVFWMISVTFGMQNLCFGTKCNISGYQSCEASILVHWTQNDVCECFRWFRKPLARKNLQNLCFGPKCTISGYQSFETSILVLWTQNDVWGCFRAFR
jgi:hypothetical protein